MSVPTRLSQARKAVRPALKGRMMLMGPSGAGKTRSGLILATVLAEGAPILGIDTEKESMLTYADDFDFAHLPWHPPFDAQELAGLLGQVGDDYGVVIVDSLTHFWRKEGGVLDIAGGKFTGWKEARPVQETLVDAILNCKAHVILGVRSKVEHVQEVEGGKQVVKKIGMSAQQDDDLEFEMNVAVELSMDHTATISKSRTTVLPVGRAFKPGNIADLGGLYRDWLKGGEPPAAAGVVKALVARIEALEPASRKRCKEEFFAAFGKPDHLRESQTTEADRLVARFEHDSPPDGGTQASPPIGGDGPASPTIGDTGAEVAPPPSAPATGRRKKSDASTLHIEAGRIEGVGGDGLDLVIANQTGGATTSAKDLDTAQVYAVADQLTRLSEMDLADRQLWLAEVRELHGAKAKAAS